MGNKGTKQPIAAGDRATAFAPTALPDEAHPAFAPTALPDEAHPAFAPTALPQAGHDAGGDGSLAHAPTQLEDAPSHARQRFVDGVFSSRQPAAPATPTPFEAGPTVAAPTGLADPVAETTAERRPVQPASATAPTRSEATSTIRRRPVLAWWIVSGALVLLVAVVAGFAIAWVGLGSSAGSDGAPLGAPDSAAPRQGGLGELTPVELRDRLVRMGWTIDPRASQLHDQPGVLLAVYAAKNAADARVFVYLHRYANLGTTDQVAQSFPQAAHIATRRDGATLLVVIVMQGGSLEVEPLADQLSR